MNVALLKGKQVLLRMNEDFAKNLSNRSKCLYISCELNNCWTKTMHLLCGLIIDLVIFLVQ